MSVCVFAGKELLPHKVSAVSFIHKKSVRKETHVHLDSEVSVWMSDWTAFMLITQWCRRNDCTLSDPLPAEARVCGEGEANPQTAHRCYFEWVRSSQIPLLWRHRRVPGRNNMHRSGQSNREISVWVTRQSHYSYLLTISVQVIQVELCIYRKGCATFRSVSPMAPLISGFMVYPPTHRQSVTLSMTQAFLLFSSSDWNSELGHHRHLWHPPLRSQTVQQWQAASGRSGLSHRPLRGNAVAERAPGWRDPVPACLTTTKIISHKPAGTIWKQII